MKKLAVIVIAVAVLLFGFMSLQTSIAGADPLPTPSIAFDMPTDAPPEPPCFLDGNCTPVPPTQVPPTVIYPTPTEHEPYPAPEEDNDDPKPTKTATLSPYPEPDTAVTIGGKEQKKSNFLDSIRIWLLRFDILME